MRLRDSDHVRELRAALDLEALRADMAAIREAVLHGRQTCDVPDGEATAAFSKASGDIERKYGVDIWDAMVLLVPDTDNEGVVKDAQDREWEFLYAALGEVLRRFGVDDPYGDGDYWINDDNWGDHSCKVEVARAGFLTPELIASVQVTLQGYPSWRVILQVNEPVGPAPTSTASFTVRHDGVEAVGTPKT